MNAPCPECETEISSLLSKNPAKKPWSWNGLFFCSERCARRAMWRSQERV